MRHEPLSDRAAHSFPSRAEPPRSTVFMTSTTRQVRKVAVLGANGAMGSGGGELFAADGIETIFLARDHEKAREGLERAQSMAKSEKLADFIHLGTYDHDLPDAVAQADLIFEALAEDLALKEEFFKEV